MKVKKTTLKDLRKKKGLSQEQLGKILNVTSQAIANYENGKRQNQLDFVKKYANTLDISLDEFFEILKQSTS